MCNLFGVVKKWLQEGGVSTDSAIVSDTDTIVQIKNMFSQDECDYYRKSIQFLIYPVCKDDSMLYVTHPEWLFEFAECLKQHFMTEMVSRGSCPAHYVRSDIDTIDKNTKLLSTDRLFYNFMVDTLDAGNICQAMNDTVTLSTDNCK